MKRRSLILLLSLAAIGAFGLRAWRGWGQAEAEPLKPAAQWRLGNAEALTMPNGFNAPAWSPDGGALAFVNQQGTFRYSLADKSLRELSKTRAGYKFFWTRDGGALAYRAHTPGKPLRIDTLDAATGRVQTLAEADDLGLPQETAAGALQFRDGAETRLLAARDGATLAAQNDTRPYVYQFRDDIYVNGSKLTRGDGQYFLPQLSPDGQKVVYQELARGLFIADLVSGVTVNAGAGHDPAWSPDGKFIVFAVTADDGHNITAADLFVADAAGRRQRLTGTPNLLEMNPAWSPDGAFIAFDAGGAIYRATVERR
jgi:Tol biopolymer transport system component